MAVQSNVKNPDGSTTITYTDGSSQTTTDGGKTWTFTSPQGQPIDSQALYASAQPDASGQYHVGSEAEQNALYTASYSGTVIPRTQIGFTQTDGTNRPYTSTESNQMSNAANGALGRGGLFGLGSSAGDVLDTTAKAVVGVPKQIYQDIVPPPDDPTKTAAGTAVTDFNTQIAKQAAAYTPTTAPQVGTTAGGGLDPSFLATGSQVSAPSPTSASQVTAPAPISASQVGAPDLGFQASLVAPTIGSPGTVTAPRVDQPTGVTAQQVAAPEPIRAGTVEAQTIAPMQLQGVPGDISLAGTAGRTAQLDALGMYRDAALGNVPSAAEALMQKGIDANVGAAYGLAASLQGRNTGTALRSGLSAAGDTIARSTADMAALRAKEQADARAGYAALGTSISQQDYQVAASNQTKNLTVAVTNLQAKIDVAKANADNALRAGMANQAAQLQADIASMQANLDAAKTNATLSLNADIASMTAKLDASKADAANQLQASIANTTNELTRLKANADMALQAGLADQAATLQAQIAQMTATLEADKANQAALLEAAKANQSTSLAADTTNATLQQQATQFNAGQTLDASKTNATLTQQNSQFNANQAQDTATTNATLTLQQQQINNAYQLGLMGLQWSAIQGQYKNAQDAAAAKAAYDAGYAKAIIGGVTAIATGGASVPMGAADSSKYGSNDVLPLGAL